MNLANALMSADGPRDHAKLVREAVLAYLRTNVVPGEVLKTAELAELLWPVRGASGQVLEARKAMVDQMLKLARKDLAGICCFQGEAVAHRMFMGKPVRPWLWHHPKDAGEPLKCPHCGHVLSKEQKP